MKVDSYECTKYLFNNKEKTELFLKQDFVSNSGPKAFVDCVPSYKDGFYNKIGYYFNEAELKEIR